METVQGGKKKKRLFTALRRDDYKNMYFLKKNKNV